MGSQKLMDKLKKKKQELKTKSGGFPWFAVKEGVTRMRPLPVGDEVDWACEVVFFFLGRDVGGIISPATFGDKCPVMAKYNKLSKSSDPDDRALAKRFKPSTKWMVPHLRYKDEKGKEIDTDNGEKCALLARSQYQDLLDLYLDDEQGDFTNPSEGYDIKYKREGKGQMDTEYTCLPCKPTKLPKPYSKKTYDPIEMTKKCILPYDELKTKLEQFLGGANEADDDDAPVKSKLKKKKKKNRGDI
jgi:hypothetical protein